MTTYGIISERHRQLRSRSKARRQHPTPRHANKRVSRCQCFSRFVSTPTSIPLSDAYPGCVADVWGAENRQCWYGAPKMSDPSVRSRARENAPSGTTMSQDIYTTEDDPPDHTGQPAGHTTTRKQVKLSNSFVGLLKHTEALHNEVLGLRIDLNNERTGHDEQREHTLDAQSLFVDASTSFMAAVAASGSNPAAAAHLQDVWERLKRSTANLKKREETVQKLEKELKKKEGRLLAKEKQLYEEIHKTRDDVRSSIASEDALTDDSYVELSAYSGSTDDENSLVHKYYDLMGDAKIFRERLFNFESEHQHQLSLREEQRQLGELPDPPDEIFYRAYFSERKALIQDLSTAKADMQQLKVQCELAGMSVEAPSLPPLDDADALDHSRRVPRRAIHYALPPDSYFGRLTEGITLVFGDIDNQAFVGRWLNEVRQAKLPESSDVFVPNTKHPTRSKAKSNEFLHWTEREAEELLPLPDYGLLSTTASPGDLSDKGLQAFAHSDPPRRRYSEPTTQMRRFDVRHRDRLELETSNSVG
jgi:hypothetical protein